MDLWHLTVFCEVVRQHSFSKAGHTVRLSQPTVSSHIKALETHYGCRLVDRLGRRVEATPAGHLLFQQAQRLLAQRDDIESAMAAFQGKIEGCLRIGASTTPGAYLLPVVIGKFVERHPRVKVSLEIADTKKTISATSQGGLELAVVGARSNEDALWQKALVSDEMRLMVPNGHEWAGRKQIGTGELKGAGFVLREFGSGTLKSISQQLAVAGISMNHLNVVAQMGSTEAVKQAIIGGLGVSILSTIAVANEIKGGLLYPLTISGVKLERHFYLTTHRLRTLSPVAAAFIAFLKSYYLKQQENE
jgi:DNA-binding transcriptional LysR family regulator